MTDVLGRAAGGRGANELMFLVSTSASVLSLIVIGMGVYSVAAFAVEARTRELAIRSAIGAGRVRLLAGVTRDLTVAVGIGLCVGTLCVVPVAKVLESLLFGVQPMDPVLLTVAGAVTVLAAIAGLMKPAIEVCTIEPATILRR